ncbi:unnamed protein product [Nesidiocoris tenuis]|uniref:Uncharacterized protein n=1 Tax=Nesidiocoris tenuis TaxID=355587 RepID=A0A6H5GLC7_9HEMI|nr:unnamed protein product [Nesidiocoris tenuis]
MSRGEEARPKIGRRWKRVPPEPPISSGGRKQSPTSQDGTARDDNLEGVEPAFSSFQRLTDPGLSRTRKKVFWCVSGTTFTKLPFLGGRFRRCVSKMNDGDGAGAPTKPGQPRRNLPHRQPVFKWRKSPEEKIQFFEKDSHPFETLGQIRAQSGVTLRKAQTDSLTRAPHHFDL